MYWAKQKGKLKLDGCVAIVLPHSLTIPVHKALQQILSLLTGCVKCRLIKCSEKHKQPLYASSLQSACYRSYTDMASRWSGDVPVLV